MRRLGYQRYVAHGTDIGASVSGDLAIHNLDGVLGAHVATDRAPSRSSAGCCPRSEEMTESQRRRLTGCGRGRRKAGDTSRSSPRGRTSHTLSDSPPAQLAWIVEKFQGVDQPAAELPKDAVDRDHLLTNVSIYWFTGTGASAATFIYEAAHAERDWASSPAPTGVAVFGADETMRYALNRDGHVEHWSEFDRGGHFRPWRHQTCSWRTSGSSSATFGDAVRPAFP